MDNNNNNSTLDIFDDNTKQICMCTFISIFLIILFILSPLSNLFKTSLFMKVVIIIILIYTIHLNISQTHSLRTANDNATSEQIKTQLRMNIIGSYIFTIFLGLLTIFIIKSFF